MGFAVPPERRRCSERDRLTAVAPSQQASGESSEKKLNRILTLSVQHIDAKVL